MEIHLLVENGVVHTTLFRPDEKEKFSAETWQAVYAAKAAARDIILGLSQPVKGYFIEMDKMWPRRPVCAIAGDGKNAVAVEFDNESAAIKPLNAHKAVEWLTVSMTPYDKGSWGARVLDGIAISNLVTGDLDLLREQWIG